MRAKMIRGIRVINGLEPRTLYPGDIIDGAEATAQVVLGNAEALPDEEPASETEAPTAEVRWEAATARPGEKR